MKAAYFADINKVEYRLINEPEIANPDDVKIKIVRTGICTSDIIGLQGQHPTRKPPVISGHESSGIVVDIGEGVDGFQPGDRVAIEPQYGCQQCFACASGRYNVCKSKTVLGTAKWSGSFAEYIVAPMRTLIKLPDTLSFEMGALLEPLAVGMHSARHAGVERGKSVVVLGSGTIGISCMLASKLLGADQVIMLDILDYNLQLARQMGANTVVSCQSEKFVDRVIQLTGGKGADIVFVAVGIRNAIDDSVAMANIGGKIMMLAHFGAQAPDFDIARFRYKELSMSGTVMYTRQDYVDCIDAIDLGKYDPKPMITKIIPIENCVDAFKLAQNRSEPFIKLMFAF